MVLDALRFRGVNTLWLASQTVAHRAFRAALERPAEVQAHRLLALLRRNGASAYGRKWGFDRIGTAREYQDSVPIVTADDLAPWIEAIKDGRPNVLSVEPVLMMEKTGGSTRGSKYIPYTASLVCDFQRAISAWMVDLYAHRPSLTRGGAYWSVSPSPCRRETTRGGIPVGFSEDTEYFGRVLRWALRRLILTPPELSSVEDMVASRYVTLRFLLDSPHLTFISIWNPSFLTLLVASLSDWAPQLIDDIERGSITPPTPLPTVLKSALARRLRPRRHRARELRALHHEKGRLLPRDIWPQLRVISCWTTAAAAQFLPDLGMLFPDVEIQGKGLLATEGVVSIPLVGRPGAALAVTAHFYEFVDVGAPADRPRLAHELEVGKTYAVLFSTGGGLYRYALQDTVTVVGYAGRTPLVEFVGRTANISDLCGEKLNEVHVARVLEVASARFDVKCAFLMLAPEWGQPPYYTLFVEAADLPHEHAKQLAASVEVELLKSHTYAYCRALGQLGPVRAFRVERQGTATYLRRCARLGQRVGAIKPAYLHRTVGWGAHMEGSLV